jgi:predicted RNA-binding Zn-ribbon protein involved in translation (DUF1610 family)
MSEEFPEASEIESCPTCGATLPPQFATGRFVCSKCGWTNRSKKQSISSSTPLEESDLGETLQSQSPQIDFRETQNRERILIATGTFVISSILWLSIILPTLSTKKNQSVQDNKAITSPILETDQRVQDKKAATSPVLDTDRNVQDKKDMTSPVLATGQNIQGKKAMTWRLLDTRMGRDGTPYVLFGSDEQTNPYVGDTDIGQTKNLLCIYKGNLPTPSELPAATITPGGATRGSWSGGKAMVVFDVPGTALSSNVEADKLCNSEGQKFGINGFRMAEFHDGYQPGAITGWDFWADGSNVNLRGKNLSNERFWVAINDQHANPWSN